MRVKVKEELWQIYTEFSFDNPNTDTETFIYKNYEDALKEYDRLVEEFEREDQRNGYDQMEKRAYNDGREKFYEAYRSGFYCDFHTLISLSKVEVR